MKRRVRLLLCVAALGVSGVAVADESGDSVAAMADSVAAREVGEAVKEPVYHYKAEAMAATSTRRTPFWLLNNRFGLSSTAKNNGYVRGGFFREMTHEKRFSWGFGADVAVPYNFTSHFVIHQLYGEVRWRSLSLTVGSKERYMGLVNQELGSGDMTFSENSRPIPQVFLSMPEYEWVPWTRHWLAVKGYFSMGMSTDWRWERDHVGPDGRWAEKLLFHSKGLFVRVGDPSRHQVTVAGGLEMGTHFGGTVYFTDPVTGEHQVVHMPHGLKDIIKAIIPSSGGNPNDNQVQVGEVQNVYGNHVGQWSLALTYRPRGTEWGFRPYYQHYFDDHSMMFFDHAWRDMLVGFEVSLPKNRILDQLVYEYLTTKDQSGAVYWDHDADIPEQVSGRDNYYNHYIYPGWSHWGMGMGNPLLISPIYNADGTLAFKHNRVKGHHLGLKGSPLDGLDYRVLLSYTRSWGTYDTPTPSVMHNFNALVEMSYGPKSLEGWKVRLGLAADGGRLLGKSFGAMITISKSGWLKR